jgi:tetratricopeptide (TPR) repeat protein
LIRNIPNLVTWLPKHYSLQSDLMFFKSIFQGTLHFGSSKTYQKVLKMYEHRVESYFKSDVIFNAEEIFNDQEYFLSIPRHVSSITVKQWKNTVNLLIYMAQFAISGNVGAWMTEDGKILRYAWIEPKGDKAVVQEFLKGRMLLEQEGKIEEAQEALNRAIEIYNKHAQAYERRGYVNFLLKKYHDAERDFSKSINIDPSNAPAYYGRARLKMLKKDWKGSLDDLDNAIKTSLALQDIHWIARRLKADCHIELSQYEKAEFELKYFTRRQFKKESSNYPFQKISWFNYGKILLELGKHEEALQAFEKVFSFKEGNDNISEADKLLYRGIARKKCGRNGFIADWSEASKMGSKEAAEWLESLK